MHEDVQCTCVGCYNSTVKAMTKSMLWETLTR